MESFTAPDLREVVADIWAARKYILAGFFVGIILAVLFFMVSLPHYRAQMLIGAVAEGYEAGRGISVSAVDSGDSRHVALKTGISVPEDFVRLENIITGYAVASVLVDDTELLEEISKDRYYVFQEGAEISSPEVLSEYLSKRVKVYPVGLTSLRRVQYMHPDQRFAPKLLERIVFVADEIIRKEAEGSSEKRISYLNGRLAKTSNPDHRKALVSSIMEQERVRMIVDMGENFAVKVADPAASSSRPLWPRKSLFLPVFALIGAFSGYLVYSLVRKA